MAAQETGTEALPREGAHWLAGAWCSGAESRELHLRAAPYGLLGTWPRAGVEDLERAFDAATGAARAWEAVGEDERRDRIERFLGALSDDPLAAPELSRHLGLDEDEARALLARPVAAARRGLSLASTPGPRRRSGPPGRWHAAPWFASLVEVAPAPCALSSGGALVIASDARLPFLADAWGRAWEAASADAPELAALVQVLHPGPGAADELAARARDGGWSEAVAPALRPVRSFLLRDGEELGAAAERVLEGAFGRATLGGQLPGRIARVLVPVRRFSAFGAVLLERLEASAAARDPVPLVDAAALERVRTLWELGLDEGATLVFGGQRLERSESGRRGRDGRVLPTLFTNVEPEMRLAAPGEPLPVLSLLRAPSEAAGAELARRFG